MIKASFQEVNPLPDSSFNVFHFKPDGNAYKGFWHFHPEYEIVYVPHGKSKRFIGTQVSRFANGDLILLGPNLPHNCLGTGFESEDYEEYVVQFNGESLKEMSGYFNEFGDINSLLKKASTGLFVTDNCKHQIGKKIKQMLAAAPFERLLKLFHILQRMTQLSCENIGAKPYVITSVTNIQRMKKIHQIIQNSYNTNISTRKMAEKIGLTEGSFCRLFVNTTGITFKQALTEVRIQKACNLLINSNASISSIAFDCGFNSLSLFNRLFKRVISDTPNNYRQNGNRQRYLSHVEVPQ